MTGKELIIYILKNDLENEPVFKNGTFIGFATMEDTAVRLNVGVGTIYAWMVMGQLDYVRIGEEYLVSLASELITNTNE
jgi:excisionase family DNA binding protein